MIGIIMSGQQSPDRFQKEAQKMLVKSVKAILVVVMIALMLGPASLLLSADGHMESGSTTTLQPGEQQWYTLVCTDGGGVEVSMDGDPDGGAVFMIVSSDAVRAWEAGDELVATGQGANNPAEDAELFWSGSCSQAEEFYLVVEYAGDGTAPSSYSLDVSGAEVSADTPAADDAPAAEEETAATEEAEPQTSALATSSAVSRLSNQPGRAIVTARGNHFVVDSVPPLGGPNEEINPLDLLLGAQATCAAFIYETAAQENGIPLTEVSATVEGDLNPQGLIDGSVNPRIQAMRVHMDLEGATDEEAAMLAEEFQARCPMYTTVIRSAPIEITTGDEPKGSAAEGLSTATAVARVSNQPGRAIVSARGNHFVVDSVPPLGGPNEERNPLDLALGALATCGTFIYETAAEEMGIPLTEVAATVEGDFDPKGVKDGSVNPRIQAFRVKMEVSGATAEEAEKLSEEFQERCPIYTTMSRSAPVEIENVTE
jgi:uncharacterized OsmC-like protein